MLAGPPGVPEPEWSPEARAAASLWVSPSPLPLNFGLAQNYRKLCENNRDLEIF